MHPLRTGKPCGAKHDASSSLSIPVSRIKHRGPSVMLAVCRDKAFGVEESVGGEDVVVVFSNGGFDGIHGKLLEVL
jgi:hypothetical protein